MTVAIEAPLTLLQKPVKILGFDTIKFAQASLRLVPEILDAVDVVPFVREQLRMVDPQVMEVGYVERVIGPPGISINDAVGSDFFLNDGQQRLGFGIRNDGRVNLPAPL